MDGLTFEKKWDKWNYDTCRDEAKKYTSIGEFRNGCNRAYAVASKHGWLDDYTWLKRGRNKGGFWTYEKCYEEAKNYKTRGEFQKKSKKAYMAAYKHGWLNDYTWLSLSK